MALPLMPSIRSCRDLPTCACLDLCLIAVTVSFLIAQVLGNDHLFFGDLSYANELTLLAKFVLQNLVDAIQQEPSSVNGLLKYVLHV